jgi:hypothetical protein
MEPEPSEIEEDDDPIIAVFPIEHEDLVTDEELEGVALNTPLDPNLEGESGLE